jgi:hypothetical protein
MSGNLEVIDEAPLFHSCSPLARQFPPAWRDIRFRRSAIKTDDGSLQYHCPICKKGFDHTDVDFLQGDHIWPYSLFGETSWANYQLICGSCNARKRDFVDSSVRKVLGEGAFRKLVCDFLRSAAEKGQIRPDEMISLLLLRDGSSSSGTCEASKLAD